MRARTSFVWVAASAMGTCLAAAGLATAGCVNNPVHDDEVDALGPENPGVAPGSLHRPGQPCLVCHGPFGPASVQFSVGGTVYAAAGQPAPAAGASVRVEDSKGVAAARVTNDAGNFYVLLKDYNPTYPIQAMVTSSDRSVTRVMQGYVARSGSCAACHSGAPSATSAGPVVLSPDAGTKG
jgi:hypothetical protein